MTLSFWNRQYQIAQILPDFQDCLDAMARRSARLEMPFDRLSYGNDPRQFVEVSGSVAPCGILPVFIHGGYWRALEAERHRFVLPPLAALTGAVANLEYRLLPHVTLAEIVGDTLAGVRCLSDRFGARLLLIGHSAGGHLALTAASKRPDLIAGAISISGLHDLMPLQWTFLRDEVGLSGSDLVGLSPQELWAERDARHVCVAVGEHETPEFHRQAQLFASSHGAHPITLPDAHHMTVLDDLASPSGRLVEEATRLIARAETNTE